MGVLRKGRSRLTLSCDNGCGRSISTGLHEPWKEFYRRVRQFDWYYAQPDHTKLVMKCYCPQCHAKKKRIWLMKQINWEVTMARSLRNIIP